MSKNWKIWISIGFAILILISFVSWAVGEFFTWFILWAIVLSARYVIIPGVTDTAKRSRYAQIATKIFQGLVGITIYRIAWLGISIAFPEWYTSFVESDIFWPIQVFGILAAIAYSQMPEVGYKKYVGILLMFLYIFSIYNNSPATASSKTEASHDQSNSYYVDFSKESEFRFEGIGNYSYYIIPDKGSVLVSLPNGESIEITRQGVIQKDGYKKDIPHEDLFGTFVVRPANGCASATIMLSYW